MSKPKAKIRDTNKARATVIAYDMGYRVNALGDVISPSGRKRKPQPYRTGKRATCFYYRFTIRLRNGTGPGANVAISYHQLAGYQEFGPEALAEGVLVRHLNNNSEDNRPSNLALGSSSDNAMDNPEEDRLARAKHAASFRRKLNDIQVASLRRDRAAGFTLRQLCGKYGIAKSTASYIVNRKTY